MKHIQHSEFTLTQITTHNSNTNFRDVFNVQTEAHKWPKDLVHVLVVSIRHVSTLDKVLLHQAKDVLLLFHMREEQSSPAGIPDICLGVQGFRLRASECHLIPAPYIVAHGELDLEPLSIIFPEVDSVSVFQSALTVREMLLEAKLEPYSDVVERGTGHWCSCDQYW